MWVQRPSINMRGLTCRWLLRVAELLYANIIRIKHLVKVKSEIGKISRRHFGATNIFFYFLFLLFRIGHFKRFNLSPSQRSIMRMAAILDFQNQAPTLLLEFSNRSHPTVLLYYSTFPIPNDSFQEKNHVNQSVTVYYCLTIKFFNYLTSIFHIFHVP